eukprot:CAMPEP_0115023054 /NCGR_PEP_ID=MMETSP0216-20121206/32086_1 /TAXON_ID=223996 /ORGANISM="Protocruzia adherens, Strain Boccale" /LENGTH=64 /DNA_ID=CAMNT_0002396193 /DNA_START=269 /DNA_END=463 /DNA_ORIENTATION=+
MTERRALFSSLDYQKQSLPTEKSPIVDIPPTEDTDSEDDLFWPKIKKEFPKLRTKEVTPKNIGR